MSREAEAEAAARADWAALEGRLRGELLLGTARDALGVGKQLAADRVLPRPRAWIRCSGEDDVRHALDFLFGHSLPFAVRSGGHCFGDLSSHPLAVLDLEPMAALELQGEELLAQPGAQAAHYAPWLAARGRWLPSGGCPFVGLGGLALVGGFGLLGRAAGLMSDQLRALRMVDAEGRVLEVSADAHEDLHWALRGGGAGSFGVVTALRLRTHAAAAATAVHGRWPLAQAAAVLTAWLPFATQVPDALTLEAQLTAPDDDEEPAFVELFGIALAEPTAAAAMLAPLRRALGGPGDALALHPLDAGQLPLRACGLLDVQGLPAWMPSRPYKEHGFQTTHSDFFDALPDEAALQACVQALVEGRVYAQHREVEFVPWGGAYARGPDSAFAHRGAQLLVRHTAVVGRRATDALHAGARAWAAASRATLAAHASGRSYQGYADRSLTDPLRAYHGALLPRLQAVKARHDPQDRFRHAQSVPLPGR